MKYLLYNSNENLVLYFYVLPTVIRYRQIFSGRARGYRAKMKICSTKICRKIFARHQRAKKGVLKLFDCRGLFSCGGIEKPLRNRLKPLETVQFLRKFLKKKTQKFFRLRWPFFRNIGRTIFQN